MSSQMTPPVDVAGLLALAIVLGYSALLRRKNTAVATTSAIASIALLLASTRFAIAYSGRGLLLPSYVVVGAVVGIVLSAIVGKLYYRRLNRGGGP